MSLESASYINGLVETNPLGSDPLSDADGHLRLIKAVLKATFPNITGAVTVNQDILNLLQNGLGTTGAIQYFAMNTAPTGWLKANGAAVSRTTYANLFSAIGIQYGAGDGSTTFNLPDLRGEFLRGWDDGRGVDSGRAFGSAQGQAIQSHAHDIPGNVVTTAGGGSFGNPAGSSPIINSTGATGGPETRPRNVALLACIKY